MFWKVRKIGETTISIDFLWLLPRSQDKKNRQKVWAVVFITFFTKHFNWITSQWTVDVRFFVCLRLSNILLCLLIEIKVTVTLKSYNTNFNVIEFWWYKINPRVFRWLNYHFNSRCYGKNICHLNFWTKSSGVTIQMKPFRQTNCIDLFALSGLS